VQLRDNCFPGQGAKYAPQKGARIRVKGEGATNLMSGGAEYHHTTGSLVAGEDGRKPPEKIAASLTNEAICCEDSRMS